MGQIIFVTGTDTGVGKTLLTALLLVHLRRRGCHALATKPFSTGGRNDARILRRALDRELELDEINPFHFRLPVAPVVSARAEGRKVSLEDAVDRIQALAARCELLLVEGAGGLFVPLGERYDIAKLIAALGSPVLVVAANKLGAVNHTLLTVAALRDLEIPALRLVLMDPVRADRASRTNRDLIQEWSACGVSVIPFLGRNPAGTEALKENERKLGKTLAGILEPGRVSAALRTGRAARTKFVK